MWENARVSLERHAAADEHDRRAHRELAVELDGERVHRDRPDHPSRLARHAHLRSGQVAAEPVPVTDGDDADPRVALGGPAATVAGALARPVQSRLNDLARPGQDRLEAVLQRVGAERREAVEGDPAPGGVEAG